MRLARAIATAAGAAALYRRWIRRPPLDLAGKVVLFSGGAGGLGLLLARQFGFEGAKVCLCSTDEVELRRAYADLEERKVRVMAAVADSADPEAARRYVERAVSRFGAVDVIINCGLASDGLHPLSDEEITFSMEANFWRAVHTSFAALPHLMKRPEARIVNVTPSGLPLPGMRAETISAGSLISFSSALAAEVGQEGVRVVTVVPGLVREARVKGLLSLPLISTSAERVVEGVVDATIQGTPFVSLGWGANAMRIVSTLAPGATGEVLGALSRMLPKTEPAAVTPAPLRPTHVDDGAHATDGEVTSLEEFAGSSWGERRPREPGLLH